MNSYTVFCEAPDDRTTTFITCVQATSVTHAKFVGQSSCAEHWSLPVDDVCVLGVAEGDVNILYWDDQE